MTRQEQFARQRAEKRSPAAMARRAARRAGAVAAPVPAPPFPHLHQPRAVVGARPRSAAAEARRAAKRAAAPVGEAPPRRAKKRQLGLGCASRRRDDPAQRGAASGVHRRPVPHCRPTTARGAERHCPWTRGKRQESRARRRIEAVSGVQEAHTMRRTRRRDGRAWWARARRRRAQAWSGRNSLTGLLLRRDDPRSQGAGAPASRRGLSKHTKIRRRRWGTKRSVAPLTTGHQQHRSGLPHGLADAETGAAVRHPRGGARRALN